MVEAVWGTDGRSEVRDYVDAVRSVVENLTRLRPSAQREAITGLPAEAAAVGTLSASADSSAISLPQQAGVAAQVAHGASDLLTLARATASDGRQRGVGAATPAERGLAGQREEPDRRTPCRRHRTLRSALAVEGRSHDRAGSHGGRPRVRLRTQVLSLQDHASFAPIAFGHGRLPAVRLAPQDCSWDG